MLIHLVYLSQKSPPHSKLHYFLVKSIKNAHTSKAVKTSKWVYEISKGEI